MEQNQIAIYQTEDGQTLIDVRFTKVKNSRTRNETL